MTMIMGEHGRILYVPIGERRQEGSVHEKKIVAKRRTGPLGVLFIHTRSI